MSKHLFRDLERIKREILTVGSRVESALGLAVSSLTERRTDLAAQVVELDDEIDLLEVRVEEECLKALALHQPVAADLRFVIAVIKLNADLERIGDHAVHIAERSISLARVKPVPLIPEFQVMVQRVREMVRHALDALVNENVALARQVCTEDQVIDGILRKMFDHLQALMRKDPESVEGAVNVLSVCRNLERIADLSTNIAEDVLFMAEGEIVRHQHEEN